jgi:diacylglycerol kinase
MPGDPSRSGIHERAAARKSESAPRGPSAPPIPPTSRSELIAFLNSFVYAWHGLVYAVRTQRNARVHMLLGSLAILLGIILRISPVEFAMVFIAITLVFIAEMFNTVAEACIDLVTREYHPLARIAKDVAAGAVLLNAVLSVLIGALVFIPHLWPLAQRLLARL